MSDRRRHSLTLALLVASVALCGATYAAEQTGSTDLRGYGRVTAEFGDQSALFTLAGPEKADVLLGKLLADLFWDAGQSPVRSMVSVAGRDVPCVVWPPYGAMIAAAHDRQVLVIGADDAAALAKRANAEAFLRQPGLRFKPARAYPLFLDFYDLRAFKAYTHAMSSVRGQGLDSHWPFVQKYGLGGLAFQGLGFNFMCPAPGVAEWSPSDYEVGQAERNGGMIVPCATGGGELPLWAWNMYPEATMRPSPTSLIGAWGGAGAAGAHYTSWGMTPEQMANTGLSYLRAVMTRYKDSPAVGGWGIYAGSPGVEMGFHERTTDLWDYSPAGQDGFRRWLREVKGLDLPALGLRWHGDKQHFKTWADVAVPDVNSFFGDLGPNSLRLAEGWRWLRADSGTTEFQAPAADAAWLPLAMPPSQQQDFLPWGAAFYKTSFEATKWLTGSQGKELYLVCDAGIRSQDGMGVWLNGEYLGRYRPKVSSTGPIGLKVTGLICAGDNELILRVPSSHPGELNEGKVFGPVFLTPTEPKAYPYLGRELNARYVDLREWQGYGIYRTHVPVLDMARSLDAERPLILSPGGAWAISDHVADLSTRYGMGVQNTGREAFYHPWWAGLGLVAGFYGTSEPSATVTGPRLDRMLGWILLDGDSNHDLFWSLEDYIKYEKETGWFAAHQRALQLFGKALRSRPSICILRSSEGMLLGDETPWNWDVGRGELQAAHYDNAYASERELKRGLVQPFPVLLDSGTQYMDDKLVSAIEDYVRAGGTFIALHHTGRNTLLEPDTYPVSRLTGFRVTGTGKRGTIRFGSKLPVFQGWEGKQFEGEGLALDWMGNETAKGTGIGLAAAANGAVPLARWEDGSVAIGYRKLGKGRVILLGSTFWRSGKDIAGVWRSQSQLERAFFERLFTDLGVERTADCASPDVWARKFTTKNGLQDWLLAANSSDSEITTEVSFRTQRRPQAVEDLLTRQPVQFTCTPDGWVTIPNVAFAGQAVRAFAVRRANMVDALPFWWNEKTTYWRSLAPAKAPATPAQRANVVFDRWQFHTDPDGTVTSSETWKQAGFDDTKWDRVPLGAWNLRSDALRDYHGVGLYRARFQVPDAWSGHRVVLSLYAMNTPIAYDRGEFFVNGTPVADYQARGWSQTLRYDVTDQLRPGENVLAVKVTGGKEFSGLAGAIWLEAEPALSPAQDLAGPWQMMGADYRSQETVALPGKIKGRCLVRTVDVPASWAGRTVYLHLEMPSQWLGSVVINGQPINYNSYLHPYGLRTDINLAPYVRAGAGNKLELWPYATIPGPGTEGRAPTADMEITAVRIGCETR